MATGINKIQKEYQGLFVSTKNALKKAVEYLLQSCYVRICSKIFQQIIGNAMDFESAPGFADSFLYYYKNRWNH